MFAFLSRYTYNQYSSLTTILTLIFEKKNKGGQHWT